MNIPLHLEVPKALALIVAQPDHRSANAGRMGALGERRRTHAESRREREEKRVMSGEQCIWGVRRNRTCGAYVSYGQCLRLKRRRERLTTRRRLLVCGCVGLLVRAVLLGPAGRFVPRALWAGFCG